ncbi:MAG: endonuclease III domain-containing protein [Candidatus Hodarchaeota archaeon]
MSYKEILDRIESSLEGDAHLDELAKKKRDPFKILISTILSARTRDVNTRMATENLFAKYNTPNLIANANQEDLEELIKVSGFYKVKAARIKEISSIIQEKFNGKVPEDFNDLMKLPGVGAKTANCVLIYAFNIETIAVDTHVHRISNRLRWVNTKKPEETEDALKKIIPKKEWKRINRIFVKFGQEICLPLNPKHNICPIENICPKDFSMEEERKEKKRKK